MNEITEREYDKVREMCGWGLLTDSYYSCENEMISMSRAWDKEKN